jgi:SNF2 family DNA or RNA helicase
MSQRVVVEGQGFRIESGYDPDLVVALKSLMGRRWDGARRVWTVPMAQAAALKAIALRFGLLWPQEADERAGEQAARRAALAATSRATAASVDVDLKGFEGELRPYQKAGVAYLLAAKRSIQADDMGLGKTAQALATLEADGAFPALAIAPASLVLNWRSECARWLPHRKVQVVRARKDGLDMSADLVVVSYDLAKRVAPTLATRGFKAVIADEAHYLKNGQSQRTKALSNIVASIPRAHLLTGTPITNRPADLIAPLRMLGHLDREFGGWSAFAKRYCGAHIGRYGWDLSGAAHLDELNQRLRATCLVRRTKGEVLAELPPKQRAFQPVDLANAGDYAAAERGFSGWLSVNAEALDRHETQATGEALTLLNELKRLAGVGKVPAAREAIDGYLDAGRKVVVFAHHIAVLDEIQSTLAPGSFARIDGGTSLDDRQAAVERFQRDVSCQVFLASTKAAGVGLTLTAASDVLVVEQEWVPADLDQAEDRCHRIGQTQCVNAVHLVAERTIDDKLLDVVNRKRAIAERAITGDGAAPANSPEKSGSVLGEVLAAYRAQPARPVRRRGIVLAKAA